MLICEVCGKEANLYTDETGVHHCCSECYGNMLIERALKEDNIETLNNKIYTIEYDTKENSNFVVQKNGKTLYAKHIWHRGDKAGLQNTIESMRRI